MSKKKDLLLEPKKKKVIKKKRKKQRKAVKIKRKKIITGLVVIFGVLLLVALAGILLKDKIALRQEEKRKQQEAERRVEASLIMEEAKALRRKKEAAIREKEEALQREKDIQRAKKRILTTNGLQEAWEELWLEEIPLTAENENTFATIENCLIWDEDKSLVKVDGVIPGIPKSDSDDIYLFALNTYETSIPEGAEPADTYRIEKTKATFEFFANLNNRQAASRMFKKFVVAAKVNGEYKIISKSRYITNPEAVARYSAYTPASSIKGLLVDPLRMEELPDLGVKQAAYNIPLSRITGHSADPNHPTIYYNYNGKTYAIDGSAIYGYDVVFGNLSSKGIRISAILLNDINYEYPELMHPLARSGSTAPYVMFNGSEQAGIDAIGAMATFLAERYSGSGHGTVSNWIVANEINARREWNYIQYMDVASYTQEYVNAFRVFYNAIKAVNGKAEIYMPLDQQWNRNLNNDNYDARDVLDHFNTIIKEKGNIDWHLAYHPYPVPLTNAAFWNTELKRMTTDSVDTEMVNMKNLHIVTDYICQEDFLMESGETRNVLLSEQGFTSSSHGEGMQAAAFAYAYYIAEANSHVNGFLLNRQTDAPEEVAQGLAFGLNHSNGVRKQVYNVYKQIDTKNSKNATEFAKSILGISDWSSVIKQH